MATRQYIGARYVPVFADPVQWSDDRAYEPLMMVQSAGETYITKQATPIGAQLPDISQGEEDNAYWVHMSNWNAQIEQYREEVLQYNGRISALELKFDENGDVAANLVNTASIEDGAVTTAKIADANVTTSKIADANVTTAKIANANVTTDKIADANVTTSKIADGAVTTSKIADANVTTAKIANASITPAKLASGINLKTNIVGTEMISIGDSYFAGSRDNDNPQVPEAQRMQYRLATQLGLTCHDYSQGGIGFYYSYQGGATHIIDKVYAAVADTSYDHDDVGLIVIGAGRNDTQSDIDNGLTGAVESVFNTLFSEFPNAKIMYFFNYDWGGHYGGANERAMMHNMHVIYRTVENLIPPVIVDQNAWTWFLGEKQNFDNIHPNPNGHRAFAAKMYNMLFGNSISESKVYTEGSIQSGLKSGSNFTAQRQGNLLQVHIDGQFSAMTQYTDNNLCTIYNCAAWGGTTQTGRIDMLFGSTIVQVKAIADGPNLKIQATPYATIADATTCCINMLLPVII